VITRNGKERAAITGYIKLFSEKYSGNLINSARTIKVQPVMAAYFRCRPGIRNARNPIHEISTRYSIITQLFTP
jgi:hypothetical protein